ncbi:unnamed protein product [Urochloa humidicola]
MEHRSLEDTSASTFSIMEEDHTFTNSVKLTDSFSIRSESQFLPPALSPFLLQSVVLIVTFDCICVKLALIHQLDSLIMHFHTIWARLLEDAVDTDVDLV